MGDTPFSEYEESVKRLGAERAERVQKLMLKNYTRLALINTGLYDIEKCREYTRKTAKRFNLRYEEIQGSNDLILRMIAGEWNDEFVVVRPGGKHPLPALFLKRLVGRPARITPDQHRIDCRVATYCHAIKENEMSQSSASITPGSSKAPTVPPYAWVILTVAFIASVAAPLNQNKVSPLMPTLMDAFQITLSSAGLMMSVFAVTGFILALPAGIILQRVGPKVSATIAMACLVLGSALGAITLSYPIMLVSRVIEGAGLGLIAVIAPAVIAMWFPPEKQGAPMGIWATWVPVGTMIILLVGPAMSAALGLAIHLVARGRRRPVGPGPGVAFYAHTAQHNRRRAAVEQVPPLRQALANRNIWLLALGFCLL